MAESPFGIDADRVRAWMADHVDTVVPPARFTPITGGLSNLTYLVDDGAGVKRVLRRPPAANAVRSTHDVTREWRILDALADSAVPVPRVLARCRDVDVTGSDFYLMSYVDGIVLHDAPSAARLAKSAKRRASEQLVDAMLALHAVEVSGVIAEYRRAEPYAPRQLRRWSRQIVRDGETARLLTEIALRLGSRIPVESRTTVVHGDYRPGNVLFGLDGTVRAILDWELWTVGDPLADLGWLVATGESDFAVGWAPRPDDGFLDGDGIVARYADSAPCDARAVQFHRALAMWKLAVIAEGVVARYAAGAMGEQHVDLEEITARPRWLAERAAEILAE